MSRFVHMVAILPVTLLLAISVAATYAAYALIQCAESFDEKENTK